MLTEKLGFFFYSYFPKTYLGEWDILKGFTSLLEQKFLQDLNCMGE